MKKFFLPLIITVIFIYTSQAQVAINTTGASANYCAMLDISSTSKGLLIPRIALTSAYDNSSIISPVISLLIYNTSNTGSGIFAVTPGFYYWTGSKWSPITAGGDWSLTGNAGVSATNNFIGTTDNQPVRFRVNNIAAGELNPTIGNILLGMHTLTSFTPGHSNIAIGTGALHWSSDVSNQVAIGDSALYSNGQVIGPSFNPVGNTAIGSKALYSNTVGYNNTATGNRALAGNASGNNNTAMGFYSQATNDGYANTSVGSFSLNGNYSGNENVAIGSESMEYSSSGSANTAVGVYTLGQDNSGSYNTAVGNRAAPIAKGNWNTALGCYALSATNTGQANVAIGFQALQYNTSGDNNTAIGTNAGPANGVGVFSNSTAIGQTATYNASNQVRVGNTAVTSIGGYANFVNLSDIRFKKNVQPETHGLDFIMKLQPIVYNLDVHKLNSFLYGQAADTLFKGTARQAITDKEAILYSGFSAQQVEEAANKIGYNFSGVQKPQNEKDHYALAYSEFVVPLVKAVQEQQALIEKLQQEIELLKQKTK